jgi:hypothetical protein
VTGENGLPDEGLLYVFGAIRSRQIQGGAIHRGHSGVTGNGGAQPIFTTGAWMGQPGTQQILSDDGVGDWGITSTRKTTSIKYNTVLYYGLHPAYLDTPYVTANPLPHGVEFKVGTFTVTINPEDVTTAMAGKAATAFDWVNSDSVLPYPYLAWVDGSSRASGKPSSYLPSTYVNSIQFTAPRGSVVALPEPGSAFGIAVLLCGLVTRPGRRFQSGVHAQF